VTALSFYLACLGFGGVLIVGALVGHHGGGGHDAGHDHDQIGLGALASLRFWSFALAFFGLTGTALTALGAVAGAAIAAIAGGTGIGAGYGAYRAIGTLVRKPVGLLGSADAHVGREGVLLLPVAADQRGKVRLTIGGASTDLVAESDSAEPLPAGAEVIVVALRGAVAVVERSPTAPRTLPPHKESP
jgi:membrane protein implicated in regulation of membrane protease activity